MITRAVCLRIATYDMPPINVSKVIVAIIRDANKNTCVTFMPNSKLQCLECLYQLAMSDKYAITALVARQRAIFRGYCDISKVALSGTVTLPTNFIVYTWRTVRRFNSWKGFSTYTHSVCYFSSMSNVLYNLHSGEVPTTIQRNYAVSDLEVKGQLNFDG